jgi:hypothetical protein
MKFNLIMKRLYIITIVLIAALTQSSWTYGQPPGDRGEKMQAMRISFITGELALTPEEAQVFWPVFNKFESEQKALRQQYDKKPGWEDQNIETLSDVGAEKLINDEIAFQQKDLEITKKYVAEFKKILPVKKVALLMTVDHKWKRMILEQIKGPGGPPPPRK